MIVDDLIIRCMHLVQRGRGQFVQGGREDGGPVWGEERQHDSQSALFGWGCVFSFLCLMDSRERGQGALEFRRHESQRGGGLLPCVWYGWGGRASSPSSLRPEPSMPIGPTSDHHHQPQSIPWLGPR